jgi:putative transposase
MLDFRVFSRIIWLRVLPHGNIARPNRKFPTHSASADSADHQIAEISPQPYWSAQEVAAATRLIRDAGEGSILPCTAPGVRERARRRNWRARSRGARGVEYSVLSMTAGEQAQLARAQRLLKSGSRDRFLELNEVARESERAAAWTVYEQSPETHRRRAQRRLAIVDGVVDELVGQRLILDERRPFASVEIPDCIVSDLARQHAVSRSSVLRWIVPLREVERADFLPHLLDDRRGGGRIGTIPESCWDLWKSDYLRRERPSGAACYLRASRAAAQDGVTLPPVSAFFRRLRRELSPAAIALARYGDDALRASYPAQRRSRAHLHAGQAVNGDGHRFNVRVRLPDGRVVRPLGYFWQDLQSNLFVGWSVSETENADLFRRSFAEVCRKFLPVEVVIDNGRGGAAKEFTGGIATRFRWRPSREEAIGLFSLIGCRVHFTIPRAGQSKPIERAFRELDDLISRHPKCAGAYTGRNPFDKPFGPSDGAVDLADFLAAVAEGVSQYNSRPNRRTDVAAGRSFQQTFDESTAVYPLRKATATQLRLILLKAISVTASAQTGEVRIAKNRYWWAGANDFAGENLVVRFDPDALGAPVFIHRPDGSFVATADCIGDTPFDSEAAAREHARARSQFMRAQRAALAAQTRMSAIEIAKRLPSEPPAAPPSSKTVRLVRLNPSLDPIPDRDDPVDRAMRRMQNARARLASGGGEEDS